MAKEQGSSVASSGGIGFTGLLALVFIVLKLTGHIDWSWGWVLAPIWIPALIVFVLILIGAVLAMAVGSKR